MPKLSLAPRIRKIDLTWDRGDHLSSPLPVMSLLAILLFAILLFFPSAVSAEEVPTAKQDAPESLKVLIYPVKPFFYRDAAGQWTGLEYDILSSFAEAEGRELEVIEVGSFRAVFESLGRGGGDLGSAALTITPERQLRNDFSAPYFPVVTVLIQLRGTEVERLEDLHGRRIALIDTTVADAYAHRLVGVEKLFVDTPEELLELIASGQADACATDSSIFLWQSDDFPDLVPTLILSERSFYGFLFLLNDPLKAKIDAHLEHLLESGEMQVFLRKAFGKWDTQLVDELTEGMFDSMRF